MLLWIVLGSVLVLSLVTATAGPPPARRKRPPEPIVEEGEEPFELLAEDAPAALLRYGTPADAEYLRETGRGADLHGLGYGD